MNLIIPGSVSSGAEARTLQPRTDRSAVSAFTPFACSPDPISGTAQRTASPVDAAGTSPPFSALVRSIDETGPDRQQPISSGRHASAGSENAVADICSSPTVAATSSRCSPADASENGAHSHQTWWIGEEGPASAATSTGAEVAVLLQAGCKDIMQVVRVDTGPVWPGLHSKLHAQASPATIRMLSHQVLLTQAYVSP